MQKRKPVKTIDEYNAIYPKEIKARLEIIRKLIHKIAPKAEEAISYSIPAFKLNGILLYYSAYEKHIGFYPYPSALKAFKKETAKFVVGKGSIQFPHDKPIPILLLTKIIKYRLKEKTTNTK